MSKSLWSSFRHLLFKMSNLPCNLFFVLLLISSVGLTMMNQVEGQEMCHGKIPGNGTCDAGKCSSQCAKSFAGSVGSCVQTFTNRFTCQCSWPCT
ncbi:hypothetical protein HRI_005148000 [Hibiscus trionum]|uniref:Defensin-like protein n=1 Tax=Hibiscus trionum TaxID=183268 RepID=A0A9W7JKN3_HIBTR|nr:hypothetical protein HRI_005148000 [Hibiscus trionum]